MGVRSTRFFVVLAPLLALLAAAALSCRDDSQHAPATKVTTSEPLRRFEYTQVHMGVPVRLVVYATDETAAVNACRAAYARVKQIDDAASDYKKSSELNELVRQAATRPVKVSQDLWVLLKESQRLAQATDGAFDVTVGPLVQLWRTARRTKQLPSQADIDAAKSLVGWQKVHLDEAARTVKLAAPNMKFDLGGIAKGYAGDHAIQVLKQRGITSALYEAGGDIIVSDPPPGAQGWRIALQHSGPDMPAELTIANTAVSTSGDTEQFVEIAGKRYSHVVDPKTGIGLTNRSMATVQAPQGIHTDALSTALTLIGEERAKELLKHYPGAKAWVRTVKD